MMVANLYYQQNAVRLEDLYHLLLGSRAPRGARGLKQQWPAGNGEKTVYGAPMLIRRVPIYDCINL